MSEFVLLLIQRHRLCVAGIDSDTKAHIFATVDALSSKLLNLKILLRFNSVSLYKTKQSYNTKLLQIARVCCLLTFSFNITNI